MLNFTLAFDTEREFRSPKRHLLSEPGYGGYVHLCVPAKGANGLDQNQIGCSEAAQRRKTVSVFFVFGGRVRQKETSPGRGERFVRRVRPVRIG
jgi:hypothetical protein